MTDLAIDFRTYVDFWKGLPEDAQDFIYSSFRQDRGETMAFRWEDGGAPAAAVEAALPDVPPGKYLLVRPDGNGGSLVLGAFRDNGLVSCPAEDADGLAQAPGGRRASLLARSRIALARIRKEREGIRASRMADLWWEIFGHAGDPDSCGAKMGAILRTLSLRGLIELWCEEGDCGVERVVRARDPERRRAVRRRRRAFARARGGCRFPAFRPAGR